MTETIVACATATGGLSALVRVSGPDAFAIADRSGIADGPLPHRLLRRRGPATATGHDLVEAVVPGAPDLVALVIARLVAAGALRAAPGAFSRQAVASGRLTLDRAEAVLALAQATDAAEAAAALARLRGALSDDLGAVRERLLALRALVEAGLDFLDEADVVGPDRTRLADELAGLQARIARWRVAADTVESRPLACLVGPANAGKSALFAALTGEPALVSPIAGTTRDHLEADLVLSGVTVRLADTAGWLPDGSGPAADLDAAAIARGRALIAGASVILACSAPDAPLPRVHGLPPERTVVLATKADLDAAPDPRAVLAVSSADGGGLAALQGLLLSRLALAASGDPRQQRALERTIIHLDRARTLPADELLADDLRRASDALGDLLGETTPDDVLDAVFARFCIGK